MTNDRMLRIGVVGAVVAAICCFTPALVVLLGLLGLAGLVGGLDYVLIPSLAGFSFMTAFALWRKTRVGASDARRES